MSWGPMPYAAGSLLIHGCGVWFRASRADQRAGDEAVSGVHPGRLREGVLCICCGREFPRPVTLVHGEMKMQKRDPQISDVGKITCTYCEAHILEPRFAQGYSGVDRPDFEVTISTRLRNRPPTGHPAGRARLPAEDGGRDRRHLAGDRTDRGGGPAAPGEPGHRWPGLLGRSARSDAAEGDAQSPASNATSKLIPAEPIRIHAFPGDESTGSSIPAYHAYRARGWEAFRK
ncbi:hypothetical protein SAMN04490239_0357 [Rhodococcus koreensis]|uniref:Uncharacterized protein n=1 Tax=Rhodococcus koreensis TaxID=99653 RepID=A0A1H4IBY7_9NOCA|nr:hypothetical protein SAMN04490239_0357 [Rhodococcus koreensis]